MHFDRVVAEILQYTSILLVESKRLGVHVGMFQW